VEGEAFLSTSTLKMGISIHMARIGTRLDQVVDVFYVPTSTGEKIRDATQCEQIQVAIQKAVDAFLNEGQ